MSGRSFQVLRALLLPLVPLYAAGVWTKRQLFERGILTQRTLRLPVIAVGSLSVGGAGKTPMVLLLAEMLGRRGYTVDVLSRGYGRNGDDVERVELPAGTEGDASRYGDEPVLLARRLGAPVFVGADRYGAGVLAERSATGEFSTAELPLEEPHAVHLLDDGFQHWRLARDVDIVLLTMRDLEDRLLPAGDLREPLTALGRADVIVLREEEASLATVVEHLVRERREKGGPGAGKEAARGEAGEWPDVWLEDRPAVWIVRRRLSFGKLEEEDFPSRPVLFCGIARPEGFAEMLARAGCAPVEQIAFRDHHVYTERDITGLIELARRTGADGFVTTEKDAVKLTDPMRERLEMMGPVIVPQLRVEFAGVEEERRAAGQLISLIERKGVGRVTGG